MGGWCCNFFRNEINVPNSPEVQCGLGSRLPSLFFNDGKKTIDFVMVWTKHENSETEFQRNLIRGFFEKNLITEGLELEEDIVSSLHFIKVKYNNNDFYLMLKYIFFFLNYLRFTHPLKCSVDMQKY